MTRFRINAAAMSLVLPLFVGSFVPQPCPYASLDAIRDRACRRLDAPDADARETLFAIDVDLAAREILQSGFLVPASPYEQLDLIKERSFRVLDAAAAAPITTSTTNDRVVKEVTVTEAIDKVAGAQSTLTADADTLPSLVVCGVLGAVAVAGQQLHLDPTSFAEQCAHFLAGLHGAGLDTLAALKETGVATGVATGTATTGATTAAALGATQEAASIPVAATIMPPHALLERVGIDALPTLPPVSLDFAQRMDAAMDPETLQRVRLLVLASLLPTATRALRGARAPDSYPTVPALSTALATAVPGLVYVEAVPWPRPAIGDGRAAYIRARLRAPPPDASRASLRGAINSNWKVGAEIGSCGVEVAMLTRDGLTDPSRNGWLSGVRPRAVVSGTLWVSEEYRRQGLAQRLLREAEGQARLWGVGEMLLLVQAKNAAALKLYTKLGYRAMERTEEHGTQYALHGLLLQPLLAC